MTHQVTSSTIIDCSIQEARSHSHIRLDIMYELTIGKAVPQSGKLQISSDPFSTILQGAHQGCRHCHFLSWEDHEVFQVAFGKYAYQTRRIVSGSWFLRGVERLTNISVSPIKSLSEPVFVGFPAQATNPKLRDTWNNIVNSRYQQRHLSCLFR